jgi:hypothetical protein
LSEVALVVDLACEEETKKALQALILFTRKWVIEIRGGHPAFLTWMKEYVAKLDAIKTAMQKEISIEKQPGLIKCIAQTKIRHDSAAALTGPSGGPVGVLGEDGFYSFGSSGAGRYRFW